MPQGLTTPDKILANPLGGKGFCDTHQYRVALERCSEGHQSVELGIEINDDLTKILRKFSKSIREWSTRSQKKINESKESRTAKASWRNNVLAVEKLVERNDQIVEAIEQKVVKPMMTFKNDQYGKKLIHIRKVKEFEKEFKKVHSPWSDHVDKMNEAKQTIHEAIGKLQQAKRTEDLYETDVGASESDKKKAAITVERRKKEVDSCKSKYDSLNTDTKSKQEKYEKDMLVILKKTDDFERERLEHFKSSFNALKGALSIETERFNTSMVDAFTKAIDLQNIDADISEFNKNFGSETKMNWPVFDQLKD